MTIFSKNIDSMLLVIQQLTAKFRFVFALMRKVNPLYKWGDTPSPLQPNTMQLVDLYVCCVQRFASLLAKVLAFPSGSHRQLLLQKLKVLLSLTLSWAPYPRHHQGKNEVVLTADHLFTLAFGGVPPCGQLEMERIKSWLKSTRPSRLGYSADVVEENRRKKEILQATVDRLFDHVDQEPQGSLNLLNLSTALEWLCRCYTFSSCNVSRTVRKKNRPDAKQLLILSSNRGRDPTSKTVVGLSAQACIGALAVSQLAALFSNEEKEGKDAFVVTIPGQSKLFAAKSGSSLQNLVSGLAAALRSKKPVEGGGALRDLVEMFFVPSQKGSADPWVVEWLTEGFASDVFPSGRSELEFLLSLAGVENPETVQLFTGQAFGDTSKLKTGEVAAWLNFLGTLTPEGNKKGHWSDFFSLVSKVSLLSLVDFDTNPPSWQKETRDGDGGFPMPNFAFVCLQHFARNSMATNFANLDGVDVDEEKGVEGEWPKFVWLQGKFELYKQWLEGDRPLEEPDDRKKTDTMFLELLHHLPEDKDHALKVLNEFVGTVLKTAAECQRATTLQHTKWWYKRMSAPKDKDPNPWLLTDFVNKREEMDGVSPVLLFASALSLLIADAQHSECTSHMLTAYNATDPLRNQLAFLAALGRKNNAKINCPEFFSFIFLIDRAFAESQFCQVALTAMDPEKDPLGPPKFFMTNSMLKWVMERICYPCVKDREPLLNFTRRPDTSRVVDWVTRVVRDGRSKSPSGCPLSSSQTVSPKVDALGTKRPDETEKTAAPSEEPLHLIFRVWYNGRLNGSPHTFMFSPSALQGENEFFFEKAVFDALKQLENQAENTMVDFSSLPGEWLANVQALCRSALKGNDSRFKKKPKSGKHKSSKTKHLVTMCTYLDQKYEFRCPLNAFDHGSNRSEDAKAVEVVPHPMVVQKLADEAAAVPAKANKQKKGEARLSKADRNLARAVSYREQENRQKASKEEAEAKAALEQIKQRLEQDLVFPASEEKSNCAEVDGQDSAQSKTKKKKKNKKKKKKNKNSQKNDENEGKPSSPRTMDLDAFQLQYPLEVDAKAKAKASVEQEGPIHQLEMKTPPPKPPGGPFQDGSRTPAKRNSLF